MAFSNARPGPVAVISIYHFCTAGFISVIVLGTKFYPQLHLDARISVRMITYLVTRHNLVPEPIIPIIMPVFAAYFAALGWGLWRLQKWARTLVITTSGLTVILWVRAFLVREWAFGESLFQDQLSRQTIYILVVVNALIFCCLTMYPDVAEAFKNKEQ